MIVINSGKIIEDSNTIIKDSNTVIEDFDIFIKDFDDFIEGFGKFIVNSKFIILLWEQRSGFYSWLELAYEGEWVLAEGYRFWRKKWDWVVRIYWRQKINLYIYLFYIFIIIL
jgi:hypothetical protein